MYNAKLGNSPHKNNVSFSEPQKLAYRKEQEMTPFELALQQQYGDSRNDWETYDDKIDFMDKADDCD